eukprot:7702406-Pyramimonas_sp.AAC.1
MVLEFVDGLTELGFTPSFDTVTRDTFKSGTKFRSDSVAIVARKVASAAKHLHDHGVMHGDLYAHNILVSTSVHCTKATAEHEVD